MAKRAVVLEIKERTCTVLTAEGEFREIKKVANYRQGQEIVLPAGVYGGKYYLVAACLLFLLSAATLWGRWMMTPAVAAYVSLDINPSVEMALDRENMVIAINPINDDGKYLIEGLTLKGLSVELAIENLVRSAVNKKYIVSGKDNVVMAAVTPLGGDASRVKTLVTESIRVSINKNNVKAQIVVGEVTPGNRDKAAKEGISSIRYMILPDVSKESVDVEPEDFKEQGGFKNEIIREVIDENISGVEPEEKGRDNKSSKAGDKDGKNGEIDDKKHVEENGRGDVKGSEGAESRSRPGEARPDVAGGAGETGSVSSPVQGTGQAVERAETKGPAKLEKEKDNYREKNAEKVNISGEGNKNFR